MKTKPNMSNPVSVYDFTLPVRLCEDKDAFRDHLNKLFKKWTFQTEKGDTGYIHYQGRGSLYKPKRLHEAAELCHRLIPSLHLSITSSPSMGDVFYVMKEDGRIEGPWSNKDHVVYIPRQYRGLTLRPWQQQVIDSAQDFSSRFVNVIYDPIGCQGKTTVASIACLSHRGIMIPPVNDAEKLMQSVCDILTAKDERSPGPVFIDLPRYMQKERLHGLLTACETIKGGYSYDMRYHYKEWWFDSPPVWVFTNIMLPAEAFSRDRWRVYRIVMNVLAQIEP